MILCICLMGFGDCIAHDVGVGMVFYDMGGHYCIWLPFLVPRDRCSGIYNCCGVPSEMRFAFHHR